MYERNLAVQLKEWARGTLRDPVQHVQTRSIRECPVCGYRGYFVSAKRRSVREFRCPNCSSRPRDRQIALMLEQMGVSFRGKRILHFAPEWPLFRKLRREPGYVGGDIQTRRNANDIVDITKIKFPDGEFDLLVCNHVLEHVPDDALGMRECARVLKRDGIGIVSVPIDQSRETTWEPPANMPVEEVERICGWDHKRMYGMDFGAKLARAGFQVAAAKYDAEVIDRHRLNDEPIYVVTKDPALLAALSEKLRAGGNVMR
jgi:SAM-dependent methyltransferase